MYIKIYIFYFITLLFSTKIYSQKIVDSANHYLNIGEYGKSDSLFNETLMGRSALILPILSNAGNNIKIPYNDLHYNHSITKLNLNDTASFCQEIYYASECLDTSAYKIFCNTCLSKRIDTIFLNRKLKLGSRKKYTYLQIIYYDKYRNILFGEILDKNKPEEKDYYILASRPISYSSNILGKFTIKGEDTVYYYTIDRSTNSKYFEALQIFYTEIKNNLKNPEPKEEGFKKYKRKNVYVYLNANFNYDGSYNSLKVTDTYPKDLDVIYVNEAKLLANLALQNWTYTSQIKNKKVLAEEYFRIVFNLAE